MEQGALSDAAFGEFADKVVLLLHVTSHVATDQCQRLLKEKGGRGFPTVAFLDGDGEVLAPQPYGKFTVAGFAATLADEVPAARALRARAAAGDAAARIELLQQQVRFRALPLAAAQAALDSKDMQLTPTQRDELENWRNTAELELAVDAVGATRITELAKAGPAVLRLRAAGHVPTEEVAFTLFRNVLLQYAEQKPDLELFGEVLDLLRARYADNPRATRQIVEPLQQKLAALQAAGK